MRATEILADFIAHTSWEDLPGEVWQRSKWAMVDFIAVTFAGLQHEVGKGILSLVKDLGGNPTSTILGDGFRTSAPWAAYANGTLAHAIDYDDLNIHMGHPTAPVLPALLAAGEKRKASGKEVLLSFILGVEAECKLGLAVYQKHYHLGWHATATLGTFGAAAACSKVGRLSDRETLMALGIAGSQASGVRQNFGTMTKPLHVGQAAKNGVLSALLASQGWTADRQVLEGLFGFCNLFVGPKSYDLEEMVQNLGKPFDILQPGVQIKQYPCCGSIHSSLDAVFKLRQEHGLRAEDVERLECEVDNERLHVLIHPNPQTGLEAKFSLEYCLAAALVQGQISLEDFADERVMDPKVRSFLPRIQPKQKADREPWSAHVRVALKDGSVLEQEAGRSPGIVTWDQLAAKYRDCLGAVLPPSQIERSLQMIRELEKIGDITEVIRNLVPETGARI
jgi:2-methylcitrate dehydratase PrpD